MACKDYVRSAASAVLATNRVLLAPGRPRFREPEIAGAALKMHRFSRRASPPNTKPPRDHRTCPYVVQFHFQDRSRRASSNTSLRSLISAIENARFTCHRSQSLISHAETSAGVRYSDRSVAWASTGGCSTRPRPRRQAPPTSAPKTRAARYDGSLAANTPRRRGASRRSFPKTPYGAAAERRE